MEPPITGPGQNVTLVIVHELALRISPRQAQAARPRAGHGHLELCSVSFDRHAGWMPLPQGCC